MSTVCGNLNAVSHHIPPVSMPLACDLPRQLLAYQPNSSHTTPPAVGPSTEYAAQLSHVDMSSFATRCGSHSLTASTLISVCPINSLSPGISDILYCSLHASRLAVHFLTAAHVN